MAWLISAALVLLGCAIVYPGGIALGLLFRLAPDTTPFSTYVWLGVALDGVLAALFFAARRRRYALCIVAPAVLLVGIEVLRHL